MARYHSRFDQRAAITTHVVYHFAACWGACVGQLTIPIIAYDLMNPSPMVAHPDDSCREMAERLAASVERSLNEQIAEILGRRSAPPGGASIAFRDCGKACASAFFSIRSCMGGWGRMPQATGAWPASSLWRRSLRHSHPVDRESPDSRKAIQHQLCALIHLLAASPDSFHESWFVAAAGTGYHLTRNRATGGLKATTCQGSRGKSASLELA